MEDAKKQKIKIGTIGIGIPGPLDAQTGVVRHPPKFKGWKNVPLGKIVHERYELPVWIENNANVSALAEKWLGSGRKIHIEKIYSFLRTFLVSRQNKKKLVELIWHRVEIKKIKGVKAKEKKILIYYLVFQKCF